MMHNFRNIRYVQNCAQNAGSNVLKEIKKKSIKTITNATGTLGKIQQTPEIS